MARPQCTTCPMCGAVTRTEATKCLSCGEALDPGLKRMPTGWSGPFSTNPYIRRIVLGIWVMLVPIGFLPFLPTLINSIPGGDLIAGGSVLFAFLTCEATGITLTLAGMIGGTEDHWRRRKYQKARSVKPATPNPDAPSELLPDGPAD